MDPFAPPSLPPLASWSAVPEQLRPPPGSTPAMAGTWAISLVLVAVGTVGVALGFAVGADPLASATLAGGGGLGAAALLRGRSEVAAIAVCAASVLAARLTFVHPGEHVDPGMIGVALVVPVLLAAAILPVRSAVGALIGSGALIYLTSNPPDDDHHHRSATLSTVLMLTTVAAFVRMSFRLSADAIERAEHNELEASRLYDELRQNAVSRAQLGRIIRSMAAPMWVADGTGRISLVNDATFGITGFSAEEIVGRYVTELIGEMPMDGAAVETHMQSATGEPIPILLSTSALYPDRPEEGTVCIATDLGARKAAEQAHERALRAAVEANRAKSHFLANMSHELRTPLNAIIGYSEMLAEEAAEDQRTENVADLQKIRASGQHLLALINDVLDLSKIEAGRMEVFLEQVDASCALREVFDAVAPLATSNNNRLVVRGIDAAGVVSTDAVKLKQIVLNLLSNACKFTHAGTISVDVSRRDGDLTIVVADQGIGMSDAQLARVFKPFVQADDSTARRFGGTGLGLSITQKFVELLRGTLTVQSALGKGTTFTVRLPTGERLDSNLPDELLAVAREGAHPVLVVDDDPAAIDLVQRTLQRAGIATISATSGEAAAAILETERVSAIILDILMPGMGGLGLLRHVKSSPTLQSVPTIMLTMTDQRSAAFALGASDYLMKPFRPQQLLDLVQRTARGNTAPILIVDDDDDLRALVSMTLREGGIEVLQARSGAEALAVLANVQPSMIFLDLLMPGMDGFEVIDRINAMRPRPRAPVVVLSASEPTEAEYARLSGSVDRLIRKGSPNALHLVHEATIDLTST